MTTKKEAELPKTQPKWHPKPPEIIVSSPVKIIDPPELVSTSAGMRTLEEYNLCPICRTQGRDNGRHHKGALIRIYLKCETCGHDWTADTKLEVIRVDHRLPPSLSER